MNETPIFTDRSQIHKTYLYLYGIVGFCILGYLFMAVRYILNTGRIPWLDLITLGIVAIFFIAVSSGRSTYEICENDLVVTYASLFRVRKLRIPYDVIDGTFHFKVEPIKTIAYKNTYRMYGSLDKRDIWSLVYNLPGTDRVSRLLLKASDEFWDKLETKLPGRIRVPQEEVMRHAYYHISGAKDRGLGPDGKPLDPETLSPEETEMVSDAEAEETREAEETSAPAPDKATPETEPKTELSLSEIRKQAEKE